jgi:calcineurin-like phosphoesterase family protein
MNLYISDTHFGHKNVISLDGRPFASVQEMDCAIIERWNEKVQDMDDVYILGDFCYMSKKSEQWYLRQLKGKKHLIIGNHDRGLLRNKEAMTFFESVEKMQYVIDGDNRIILCHYPICEWNGFHNGVWHIYGHIHCKRDDTYLFMSKRERALNAGCMINNYVPVTLNELMENNKVFNKPNGDLEEFQNEKKSSFD